MTNALEGKGGIPKEQAIELLAFLKAVAIAAPKTDLTMKQEQQVFSLQGFLQQQANDLKVRQTQIKIEIACST